MHLPKYCNIINIIDCMPLAIFNYGFTCKSYHDFTNNSFQCLHNLSIILGIGPKFCQQWNKPKFNKHVNSLIQFIKDIRNKNNILERNLPPTPCPKLYLKNPFYTPPNVDRHLECIVATFTDKVLDHIKSLKKHTTHHSNLTKLQQSAINWLRSKNQIVTFLADKNMGFGIISYDNYVDQVFRQHLLNK